MFDRCGQLQISMLVKKCIFFVPFETLLGHIVCKDGVCVDPTNVAAIVNMDPPGNVKQLISALGHTSYYRRFIRNYALITTPMERLLEKTEQFIWTKECNEALNILKETLASAPILVYPNWNKQFHIHIDASGIALGAVLVQLGEGNLDQPIYFSSRKLSTTKKNYTTTKREALAMVYYLQKFLYYLLGGPFKFFTDDSALKYLVNKLVLEGRICIWLLLFQEFTFELIVKPGRLNVGPGHLSRLESGESGGFVDDQLPDADLFKVEAVPGYFEDITTFLATRKCPEDYSDWA